MTASVMTMKCQDALTECVSGVMTMHSGQHILMNLILVMLMMNIGMLTDSVSTCKIKFRQYIYPKVHNFYSATRYCMPGVYNKMHIY